MVNKSFVYTGIFLFCCLLVGPLHADSLEEAYAKYLQGRYDKAHDDITAIIKKGITPEQANQMQEAIGLRAFLDMAQNQYLRDEMKKLSALAWQFERGQFKSPRRIDYYIGAYFNDKSLRAKALQNIVAAGEYAVPSLLDYLGNKEDQITKRGLSYQALSRIGREAIPGLVAASYSDDPVLLANIVRLCAEIRDNRALPYLARLRDSRHKSVQIEVERALTLFTDISKVSASHLMIAESNRYTRNDHAAQMEGLSSDGLLWTWNEAKGKIVAVNPIGVDYIYLPTYPPELWHAFRAEMIHREVIDYQMANKEHVFARASLLNAWIVQEYVVTQILKKPEGHALEKWTPQLKDFLKRRSLEVEIAHWSGVPTMLTALDLAMKQLEPHVSARLLQILTTFQPSGLLDEEIVSFVDGKKTFPVLNAINHSSELIRYWGAIVAGRSDPGLKHKAQPLVMDLLTQAADEVNINAILLVTPLTKKSDDLRRALTELGYSVYLEENGHDGLNALKEFPSKDLILVSDQLVRNMSTLVFVNKVRNSFKGKSVPMAIVTQEKNEADVLAMYQDHAQSLIFENETGIGLKEKVKALAKHRKNVVYSSDIVKRVSREALTTIKMLNQTVLQSYPAVVKHLIDLLSHPYHKRVHEILAIQILAKYADLAVAATPVLLEKFWSGEVDDQYKIEVLTTLRHTSRSHPKVRESLFKLAGDHNVDRKIRIQAASFLGLDHKFSTEREKRIFQNPFFTTKYPKASADSSGM